MNQCSHDYRETFDGKGLICRQCGYEPDCQRLTYEGPAWPVFIACAGFLAAAADIFYEAFK